MRDIYRNIMVTAHLNPLTATTTRTSTTIDLQGYNAANVVFSFGATGDTLSGSVYWTLKLQHSSDDSSYSDVTSTDVHGGVVSYVVDANSEDETVYRFGYVGNKRYLKAVATPTGTHTNGTPMAVVALRGEAAYSPVV
ncbi:MAG: hypothetical protein ACK502_09250 [Alphaproteobacteria bacterium]